MEGTIFSINQAIDYAKSQYNEEYHYNSFYRWLKEGKIRGFHRGGQWRVFKESLDAFFCPVSSETPSPVVEQ